MFNLQQIILRRKLFILFLWLSVINLSVWIGGTLFHMIVVLPIWSKLLPGSVSDFFGATLAYEYLLDFYGPQWMVIRIVPVIIALLLAWNYKRHRRLLLVTFLTIMIGVIGSIVFIFPINEVIMANAGEGMTASEITQMINQ